MLGLSEITEAIKTLINERFATTTGIYKYSIFQSLLKDESFNIVKHVGKPLYPEVLVIIRTSVTDDEIRFKVTHITHNPTNLRISAGCSALKPLTTMNLADPDLLAKIDAYVTSII